MPIETDKEEMRSMARERLKQVKLEYHTDSSKRIAEIILASDLWNRSRTICLYHPLPTEPDSLLLYHKGIAAGKTMVFPRAPKHNTLMELYAVNDLSLLVKGDWGMREPHPLSCEKSSPSSLNLILIPGLAFDSRKIRLGRGKGYYDRFLACPEFKGHSVGVFFSIQQFDDVPAAPHDRPLDVIFTEEKIFEK